MASAQQVDQNLVRFGRRQTKGLLLGLSGARLLAVGAALIVFVAAIFTSGMPGVLLTMPLWAGAIACAFVRWHGDPVADALPNLVHWAARSSARQTRYRARPFAVRPAGSMALPGDSAALRFHLDASTGAAMIHDPHRRTLAAVVRVSHPAYVLLSPDDQARRVTAWSRVLAGLAATGTCAAVQILESTLPDRGHGVRDWHAAKAVPGPSWPAVQYEALLDQAAPASYTHRTLVTLSLDLRSAGRAIRDAGRGMTGAAEVLRGDMATFSASLRAADLRVDGWVGAADLAAIIRETYEPAVDPMESHASLSTAGPVAVDEHWDHLRHDSAFSSVLWISEWPRVQVAPHFLHSLVFLPGVRKSISIIAKPLGTSEALRAIRKEKVDYLTEAAQNARIGRIADLSAEQEYSDVLARERALISGHADLRFSGFIVITTRSHDELIGAVAVTQRAASQSGCETRILAGQQSQAFIAAGLPLGRGAR